MTKHIEDIRRALDVMHLTCDTIQKFDGCKKCPMAKKYCLEETDVFTLCEEMTETMWTAFFEYSDYVQTIEACSDSDEEDDGYKWDDERNEYELMMEEYYARLPRKEINVYGHNITIIG